MHICIYDPGFRVYDPPSPPRGGGKPSRGALESPRGLGDQKNRFLEILKKIDPEGGIDKTKASVNFCIYECLSTIFLENDLLGLVWVCSGLFSHDLS